MTTWADVLPDCITVGGERFDRHGGEDVGPDLPIVLYFYQSATNPYVPIMTLWVGGPVSAQVAAERVAIMRRQLTHILRVN